MASSNIPDFVLKYFWGDDIKELSLEKNKDYLIQTILEKGDQDSVKWLFKNVSLPVIKEILPNIKLTKKSGNFWNLYLS